MTARQLPDLSTMPTVEAIVWYTRQVREVTTAPDRAERIHALLEWKRALNERIALEREYAAKLRDKYRYAGLHNAGNWFGLTYRALRHDRLLAASDKRPTIELRRTALRNAWREFARDFTR